MLKINRTPSNHITFTAMSLYGIFSKKMARDVLIMKTSGMTSTREVRLWLINAHTTSRNDCYSGTSIWRQWHRCMASTPRTRLGVHMYTFLPVRLTVENPLNSCNQLRGGLRFRSHHKRPRVVQARRERPRHRIGQPFSRPNLVEQPSTKAVQHAAHRPTRAPSSHNTCNQGSG